MVSCKTVAWWPSLLSTQSPFQTWFRWQKAQIFSLQTRQFKDLRDNIISLLQSQPEIIINFILYRTKPKLYCISPKMPSSKKFISSSFLRIKSKFEDLSVSRSVSQVLALNPHRYPPPSLYYDHLILSSSSWKDPRSCTREEGTLRTFQNSKKRES